ncbi:MAG: class I SAM-dependent methyltransferase [Azovibrio sp.]
MQCGVCGGTSFSYRRVLWDGLIREWQLSNAEAAYIDRQQGEACDRCGANLRSIALANALKSFLGVKGILIEAMGQPQVKEMAILEINEAGSLTPLLRTFGNYTFGAYPQVDIHALPYQDCTFDVVIHSDTLEHVQNPVHALMECIRVLKPHGALCFTVPVVVGRMSRNRDGLPKSFHGGQSTTADDYAVQTEFGADVWTYLFEAEFTEVSIHTVQYPSGIAFLARRPGL